MNPPDISDADLTEWEAEDAAHRAWDAEWREDLAEQGAECETPSPGDTIYVTSAYHISRGSDDFAGGLATVSRVYKQKSGGKMTTFVEVVENAGVGYNWGQYLSKQQDELRERFGNKRAHPDPDVDTPWLEDGDYLVDEEGGRIYHGPPQW